MTIEELSKLSDKELDRLAAEKMETLDGFDPEQHVWDGGSRHNESPLGWWKEDPTPLLNHSLRYEDRYFPVKSATGSLDVAAMLEAKVIEECGWMMYEDFLIGVSVGRDNYNSNYRAHREALHTSTARQRTIAALACLADHIPDAGEMTN